MNASNYGNIQRKKCIQHSDPGKILDLILRFTDKECSMLEVKTNVYLLQETESDVAFQIIVNTERMEAYIDAVNDTSLPRKMKVAITPKLADVLKSSVDFSDYLVNFGQDILDIIMPFYTNPNMTVTVRRKPKDTDSEVPMDKVRVVMLSIVDTPFSTIVCVVAPNIVEEYVAITIHELYLFIWPTLSKAIALDFETSLRRRVQQLLRVVKRLFAQVESFERLLPVAKEQAKFIIRTQNCLIKLIDVESMELYEPVTADCPEELRFPMKKGFAGEVIEKGYLINVRNPSAQKRFNKEIDSAPGIHCDLLLDFPIRDRTGIIGVGQLINHSEGSYFDSVDEEMALSFGVFLGLCISHAVLYRRLREMAIRNKLAYDLLIYHLKPSNAEIYEILDCPGFHSHPELPSLKFNTRVLPYRELPCYFIRMLRDRGLIQRFKLNEEKLARFVMTVKRSYRDVPYHNWSHAFNTAQWAYAACCNFKLVFNDYFTELQELMYLIAALCHDIDHRGITSCYEIQGETTVAALFTSEGSVMERHHLAQTIAILNMEGCDILEPLSRQDYDRAILLLKEYILATDINTYLKNYNDYKVIAYDYLKGNRVHIAALQAILMNCADLSDQTQEWEYVKKANAAILTEFFQQGDPEKIHGEVPMMIMDREKCYIPDLQINFLQKICIPLYELLGCLFAKAEYIKPILESYVAKWEEAKLVFNVLPTSAGLGLLTNPELDKMVEEAKAERQRRLLEEQEEEEDK